MISSYASFIIAQSFDKSKVANLTFSLGTKRALGLFYMTFPGFSVVYK